MCPGSCDGLAGESPAGVAAKRPRSWWPAEGEIRLSKRHDKVAVGGEQVVGPYERVPSPADRGEGHGRCEDRGCAARETRRRTGSGTITQPIVEQERSVSTPAARARRVPSSGAPVTQNLSAWPAKWWSVERKSEEGVVARIGVDNTTRRSEGPLTGRCPIPTGMRPGAASALSCQSPPVTWRLIAVPGALPTAISLHIAVRRGRDCGHRGF